jgi:hypothetical protein
VKNEEIEYINKEIAIILLPWALRLHSPSGGCDYGVFY